MIEEFVIHWGYVAILVGTLFEGETVLLLGGALAHRGLLSLPAVMVMALLGSFTGDQLAFFLGKRLGRAAIDRRPHWHPHVARAERWLSRYGTVLVLGFRFVYGIRIAFPVLLGSSGYSQRRFAGLNLVGAAFWSVSIAALGFGFGAGMHRILGRTARWEEFGALVLVLAAAVAMSYRFTRDPPRTLPRTQPLKRS